MLRAMRGQLPSLVTTAHAHLPSDDQRRRKIEDIASSNTATRDGLNAHQRDAIVAAARGAYAVGRREVMRLRSFRNVLVVTAAVLGLLLMRGEFIPGLSALDSPAQIIAWAVLLGYGQQLLTRFVDQRAQAILDASGGQTKPADD